MADKPIKLGKYLLLEEIGRGGYGTVYRARDEALQIERAVKVLNPALVADPAFIDRFKQEARLLARLKHPHIVPVYDLGEAEGRIFLVMEYIPTGSLKTRLENDGPMPFSEAKVVISQVSKALDYAHEQGFVHRDVKPGNILFDEKGDAYLSDFGFARSLASAGESTTMSLTGGILGTPVYMSPEAWDGEGWTPAADVYSLACVFFEILTGRPLFDGETPTRLMKQHVIEGPSLPETWPEGVPGTLTPVLEKATVQDTNDRYALAGEFLTAVASIGGDIPKEAVKARIPSTTTERHLAQTERDKPWWQHWVFLAGAVGIAGVILFLVFTNMGPAIKTEPIDSRLAILTSTQTATPSLTSTPVSTSTISPTDTQTSTRTPAPSQTLTHSAPTHTPTPKFTLSLTPLPEGYVIVPDVVGLSRTDAIKIINDTGFNFIEVFVQNENIQLGTIVNQIPAPEELAVVGSRIKLNVSSQLILIKSVSGSGDFGTKLEFSEGTNYYFKLTHKSSSSGKFSWGIYSEEIGLKYFGNELSTSVASYDKVYYSFHSGNAILFYRTDVGQSAKFSLDLYYYKLNQ